MSSTVTSFCKSTNRLALRVRAGTLQSGCSAPAATGAAYGAAREEAERQGLSLEGGKAAAESVVETVRQKAERVAEAAHHLVECRRALAVLGGLGLRHLGQFRLQLQIDPVPHCPLAHQHQGVVQRLGQVEARQLQLHAPSLNLGEIENLIDER